MNHQGVSEIVFEETCSVPSDQTAKSLFMRLPHGRDYASTLIECQATSYLLAMAESICIREMQRHIDADVQVIVGRSIRIEHRAPIPSGTTLRLRGWVEQVGQRSSAGAAQLLERPGLQPWKGPDITKGSVRTKWNTRRRHLRPPALRALPALFPVRGGASRRSDHGVRTGVGDPAWVSSSDIVPIGKLARDLTRRHGLDKSSSTDEFFKLCLDMGLGLSTAQTVARAVRQIR